ncbi:MAG: glycosyltransferase family 87 protein [Chloroflexota bacterium]
MKVLKRTHLNLPRLFLIAGLIFQLAWYALLWASYISRPETLKAADFQIFYIAGRIAASDRYDLVYDAEAQRQIQQELLGRPLQPSEILPFNHPPLLIPLQALVSTVEYPIAYLCWSSIMLCLLIATASVIGRLLQEMGAQASPTRWMVLSIMLFYPVFISILKGQDTAFLLLGAVLWMYGVISRKDPSAGLGLAMMAIRPQIALMLGVPFLFTRRKVLGWAALFGIAHVAAFLLIGPQGLRRFVDMLLVSAGGEGYIINRGTMFNLAGAVIRFYPRMDALVLQVIIWGAFLLSLAVLCYLWSKKKEIGLRHISLAMVLSLFAAPHLHYHDLALLQIPILCLMLMKIERGSQSSAWPIVFPISLSLVLLVSDLWDPARYSIPYLIMALLAGWIWLVSGRPIPNLREKNAKDRP